LGAAAFHPSDAIRLEEEDGVTALRYLAADLLEVQVHRLRVGIRQDQGRTDVAMRADGAEYVGPFAALIPGWTASALGPDASQCALLTNPGFVLPPKFNRLFARMLGDRGFDQIGKVFLCVSCAAGSCCG
jgi:hypothetical protein